MTARKSFQTEQESTMKQKSLQREARAESLRRYENAARTVEEFEQVTKMWDKLDSNRERKERYWEKANVNKLYRLKDDLKYRGGAVFPIPLAHPYCRELMRGDFLHTIYDSADEIWKIMENWAYASLLQELTWKQKDVLLLSAIRLASPQQIACYQDKTDRGVRKLLTAALDSMRSELVEYLGYWKSDRFALTPEKQRFIERFEKLNKPGEITGQTDED
jgi:hypothetical protein